ncbi:hypothetical protein [Pseudooceanicola sp.]|uniref:hypothetical protein n=1 Tax=Pseudooceanicola sp. TaxID=1914328 RepID=UPI004058BC6D
MGPMHSEAGRQASEVAMLRKSVDALSGALDRQSRELEALRNESHKHQLTIGKLCGLNFHLIGELAARDGKAIRDQDDIMTTRTDWAGLWDMAADAQRQWTTHVHQTLKPGAELVDRPADAG